MEPCGKNPKSKKVQSKRPRNSDASDDFKKEALEKLNRMSQSFLEGIGLDLNTIKPKHSEPQEELNFTTPSSQNALKELAEEAILDKKNKVPEVVVFNPISSTKTTSKAEYKQFMSSKIKVLDAPLKIAAPVSKKQDKEDQDNIKYDAELNDLLTNSRLIERLAASELTGKARRKHQYQQLNQLGCKKTKDHHNPTNVRFEMLSHKRRKNEELVEKAKEEGNYHKSLRHLFDADMPKKKAKSNDGLRTSMGKFQDGVLHISKAHIKRNAATARETSKNKKGPRRR
ncbi:hypothetical protein DSO57_1035252 [Entomophthora muscae]|uniref:Uncharacterized protein n=1 Tax=Entomophthora muscae TaxID=34485 RepID=A0ACC2TM16_9FUNG|nr:hypothetical protein DSO57_1035252 [Entomophthora muscae]